MNSSLVLIKYSSTLSLCRNNNSKDFVDYATGKNLKTSDDWNFGFGYSDKTYDCLKYFHGVGLTGFGCTSIGTPVCKVIGHVEFTLDGVCKHSVVDSHYILTPTGTLLGFSMTEIKYNTRSNLWEIWNNKEQNLAAFSNETNLFPIGIHKWYFNDVHCQDTNHTWRKLNLHLKAEKPGKFCCDDGSCMDASLACDGDYNCNDGSDERNCELVNKYKDYRKDRPPKQKEKNKER